MTNTAEDKLFEVQLTPDRVLLRVQPAADGGKKATLSEIQRELDKLGIKYRPETLFSIVRRARNEFEPVASREVLDYAVTVQVSANQQEAHMSIVSPTASGGPVPPAMVKAALADAKVEKGLLFDELRRAMGQRTTGQPVLIAKGRLPDHGKDGRIEFLFPPDTAPAPLGDESVDWRERNLIRNVAEGETIAKLFAPTAGVDGFAVTGRVLKARNGRKARYRVGANVAITPDGAAMVASKAGYVVQTGDKLSVEDVFVTDHVNISTGHIRFTGVVSVRGNVEDTFSVESGRGVSVGGMVGRAVIKSEGDVEIRGGAVGATIEAKGNITGKYFSDCTLRAGGDVVAEEYILHGTVDADRAIRVTKVPEGFISGTLARARTEISSAILGSAKSEQETNLEVGAGTSTRAQFDRLQAQMAKTWEVFDRERKNLTFLQESREKDGPFPEDRKAILAETVDVVGLARDSLLRDVKVYHELLGSIGTSQGPARAAILAYNLVNSGVNVQIQRLTTRVTTPLQFCAFMILDGQLKVHDYAFVAKMLKQAKRKK